MHRRLIISLFTVLAAILIASYHYHYFVTGWKGPEQEESVFKVTETIKSHQGCDVLCSLRVWNIHKGGRRRQDLTLQCFPLIFPCAPRMCVTHTRGKPVNTVEQYKNQIKDKKWDTGYRWRCFMHRHTESTSQAEDASKKQLRCRS